MDILTIVFFLLTIALYVLALALKRKELSWATIFISVIGIAQVLVDEDIEGYTPVFLIIPMIYIMLESGLRMKYIK